MTDSPPPDPRFAAYDAVRDLLDQSYTLINQRISAFFTLQGFLFTGLFVGLNGFNQAPGTAHKLILLLLLGMVCIVGGTSGRFFSPGLLVTRKYISVTAAWWDEFRRDPTKSPTGPFPWPEPVLNNPDYEEYQRLATKHHEVKYKIDRFPQYVMPACWFTIFVMLVVLAIITAGSVSKPDMVTNVKRVDDDGKTVIEIQFDGDDADVPALERRVKEILK